jgi:2-polyprenyl-3-methyl-5-hydroxy-6-metoxy-1,4-benzoquinol methylase
MLPARRLGFVVERPLDLKGWTTLDIGEQTPLTEILACPAGDGVLRVLATFVDRSGGSRIRLGCCPACGHVTYIDRPSEEWMDRYYLESWDGHDIGDRSSKRERKLEKSRRKEKTVVTLAKELDVDHARPVCEIGSGWGLSLKHLLDAGFTNAIGTESSKHRAGVIERTLSVPVLTAPFESKVCQEALARRGPYSIILTNHVMEHTYDPSRVLEAAAGLQDAGDYLIVAVPNQETEQPMSVFFFLPHLHSFTRTSLRRVAARHGYEVVDDRHTGSKQIVYVFQKQKGTPAAGSAAERVFERAVNQYVRAFSLDRRRFGLRRLWWLRRGGPTGQRWMLGSGAWEEKRWARTVEREGYAEPRSVAIRSLRRRYTTTDQSPFEIQFNGPVSLFAK